ncbi:MAG: glycosyltransferase [Ilumatobacteraceae bacterium]
MDATAATLIQVSIPGYRRAFVEDARARMGDQLRIAAGARHLDPSLTTGVSAELIDVSLRNRFLFGRRGVYQQGWLKAVRGRGVWVLELNPRVLNTWLALLLARVLRRRTLVWGHFRGRSLGETGPRLARRLQILLARGVLAYTIEEGRAFAAMFPRRSVTVVPNAVDRASELRPPVETVRDSFLSVGRAVAGKGSTLLIDGFAHARATDQLPPEARLVLIGDGPEHDALVARAAAMPATTTVLVLPGTFDQAELAAHYDRTVAGVCGGYVGLNITQCLSRGAPFVYPTMANHSPEVALAASTNSFPFAEHTAHSVATALATAWQATLQRRVDHGAIQRATVGQYSIETMVQGFMDAVRG